HPARPRPSCRVGRAGLRARAGALQGGCPVRAAGPADRDLRRLPVEAAPPRPGTAARGGGESRPRGHRGPACGGRTMMAKVLCYPSPGRGHLFPVMPILLELRRRGHEVSLLTLRSEVAGLASSGLQVRAISSDIDDIPHDDWRGSSPVAALDRAVRVFVARG